MPQSFPASVETVRAYLAAHGCQAAMFEFPAGVRTAGEAAAALGVDIGCIAKSLVFMAADVPVMVVASGRDRVDLEKLAEHAGRPVRRATPDEVKAASGYAIGGVPPVAHATDMRVYLEEHLWEYETLYAAAGAATVVFATNGAQLLMLTGGCRAALAE